MEGTSPNESNAQAPNHDARDVLWRKAFDTCYMTYYYEILSELLVKRWQMVDDTTQIVTAVTASGSLLAGWALWKLDGPKIAWAVVAGLAAVMAIIHASLGGKRVLHDWENLMTTATSLRVELETFLHEMEIDPNFQLNSAQDRYLEYRVRYRHMLARVHHDILRTKRVELRAQKWTRASVPDYLAEANED